ncbi:hypothetical protein [uncultured Tyzzerella sp.]|uniref:hypothetical protein n=1 Tax=uncultured Tyzzerella sp. TaxID=2321398 RepID=UPI0029438E11|nr:hypothetical protein [uncultured Tyzzerella sp.]
MNVLTLTAFFVIVGGVFIYLDISPTELINNIFKYLENGKKNKSISIQVKEIESKKKDNFFSKLIKESKDILEITNKKDKFSNICILSVVFMVIGIYISVYMSNYYLIPILAIGFATLPFQYIKLTSIEYKKAITEELETSLSAITSSYIRSNDIVQSIKENLPLIKPPIKNIFESFVIQSEFINSDTISLLEDMRNKINDDIFKEWVDAVISCQSNRELRVILSPIVSKLSDLRTLSAEINNELYRPLKEFFGMLIIVYINFPILYFANKDWFNTLVFSTPGKIVVSIVVVITFIAFMGVMKHTKPIDSSILDGE